MKKLRRIGLALVLTVVPTAVLLAGTEDYTSSPRCKIDPDRKANWIWCDQTAGTGCAPTDYSAQLNIYSSGFIGCVLATDGSAGYWEMGLGKRTPEEHAGCGVYCKMYRNQAMRFVRCRSDTGALPTGFKIEFGKDGTDNLPATP